MRFVDDALAACARFVLKFRRQVIIGSVIGALACAGYAATHLGINTSTADMISAKLPWRQAIIDYRQSFPALDRNIVVVVNAPSDTAADAFSLALVERLKAQPKLYTSVFSARSSKFFRQNGLLFASVNQLDQLDNHLARAQPLLGLLQSGLNGTAVVNVVNRSLANQGAGPSTLLDSFYAEVTGTLNAAAQGKHLPIAWSHLMRGAPTTTASVHRTVLVQPVLHFSEKQPAAAAIEGLHASIKALTSTAFPQVQASLTGNLAMQYDQMRSVQRGARFAGIGAFLLVALLTYAALRSWKMLGMSLVSLTIGLCVAGAFAAVSVGQLNLLSAAFAVTYIGLGTDYIIHVCLRVKELIDQGESRDDAIVDAVSGIGSSLVMSAITTAVGFYAFIPTSFTGVAELGIISGTGMFISLLVSLTFLPALLGQFLTEKDHAPKRPWLGTRGFQSIATKPAWVLIVTALFVIVTFAALPNMHFDSNPLHMQDQNSPSMKALRQLAADGEANLYNIVAIAPNHKTAVAWAEKLRTLSTVKSAKTVASLVPTDQETKLDVIADIGLVMGPGFGTLPRVAPNPGSLESALRELVTQAAAAPSQTPALQQLRTAATGLLTRLKADSQASREATLRTLDSALVGHLPEDLGQLAEALDAQPVTLQSLPPVLRERWITQDGRELVQVAPNEDVSNNAAATRFVDSVRSIVPTATGVPVIYLEASHTIVHAFTKAFLYALVAITLLLWLFLRNGKDLLLVIGPILLATGVTLGLAVLLGIPLNFASIIGLPLLVGMNVDNGIHMLHRVRSAPSANGQALGNSTSLAVFAGNLTTTVSFGMLALSPQMGMASFGQMLTLGLITTLAASMILLPALLRLRVFQPEAPAEPV